MYRVERKENGLTLAFFMAFAGDYGRSDVIGHL